MDLISEEELEILSKTVKKKQYSLFCADCPLHILKIRRKTSCRNMILKLFGIEPTSCTEINRIIYNYVSENRRNKI